MSAPFPYFGGRSNVAHVVWKGLGDTANYVEPFCGSAATLLARPQPAAPRIETINDSDGYVVNLWRAMHHAPDEVVQWCDWPVSEIDLGTRHRWLTDTNEDLRAGLNSSPEWFDVQTAGWWLWGVSVWFGKGWCNGVGRGHLPRISGSSHGSGVHKSLKCLPNIEGMIIDDRRLVLRVWFEALARRLRNVRIVYGDWLRVCSPAATKSTSMTGMFFDPPYSGDTLRPTRLYAQDSTTVAHDVRRWCLEHGDNPRMRIVLAGRQDEHPMPESWFRYEFAGSVTMAKNSNSACIAAAQLQRLWFSPHCLKVTQD